MGTFGDERCPKWIKARIVLERLSDRKKDGAVRA
jgi:hypothetical protein